MAQLCLEIPMRVILHRYDHIRPRRYERAETANQKALLKYRRKAAAEYRKALSRDYLGSHGAASPCIRIDPATGEVSEVIKPRN
jgi:hypothetical protein